jgi:hypothetical protein
MAYPRNPGDAGVHSPPSSDRTRVKKWRFASNSAQALSMVSGIAFASSALYRPWPEAGAHSFTDDKLTHTARRCQRARCPVGRHLLRMEGRASARQDMREHVLRTSIPVAVLLRSTGKMPVGPTARMAVLQPQNRLARNRCISSRIFSRTSNNSARNESSRSGGSNSFCATLSAAAMLVCK